MNLKHPLLSLVAVATLSVAAWAAVDGFTIVRKAKEGDVLKYRMVVDADVAGLAVKAKALLTEKVVKVEADGAYKVTQGMSEGKLEMSGQEQEYSGTDSTLVYAPTGEVKTLDAGSSPDVWRFANLNATRLPAKTINVNETWSVEYPADKKTGAVAGKSDYTLLGEEKVGDFETLKVKTVAKETEGTDPAGIDGTVWIDKNDGSLVKSETKWINVPFPGAPVPINATVTLNRETSK